MPFGLTIARSVALSPFRLESSGLCTVPYSGDSYVYVPAKFQLPARFFKTQLRRENGLKSKIGVMVSRWRRSRIELAHSLPRFPKFWGRRGVSAVKLIFAVESSVRWLQVYAAR